MEKLAQKVTPTTHLDAIRKAWLDHLPYRRLIDALSDRTGQTTTITGLSGSSLSFLLSALGEASKSPILVLTQHAEESANLCDDLSFLLGADRVGHFPARQILPFDFSAPQGEVMGRRISTLAGLIDREL